MLNHLSSKQIQTITLWYVVQHSLTSFRKIKQHFSSIEDALKPSALSTWQQLKLHKNHLERLQQLPTVDEQLKLQNILQLIQQHCDFVVLEEDSDYPNQLLNLEDRPPILFGQGDVKKLSQPQISIVGSRKATSYGRQATYDFAYYLSEKGFYITSGLAEGIDEAAHQAALKHNRTIAVMGTGIDLTYPSQHCPLRQNILDHQGVILTEFLPQTKPLQQNFPRRNRLVSGLALAVLVTEATLKSGSLITAQLAAEQGKLVFALPGIIYQESQQGCHHLIREGAILVDHPEQILHDVALPTQWQHQKIQPEQVFEQKIDLPEHLLVVYESLDWIGQEIDLIAFNLKMEIAELTSLLMELEIMGLILHQSGLYLRCRAEK